MSFSADKFLGVSDVKWSRALIFGVETHRVCSVFAVSLHDGVDAIPSSKEVLLATDVVSGQDFSMSNAA